MNIWGFSISPPGKVLQSIGLKTLKKVGQWKVSTPVIAWGISGVLHGGIFAGMYYVEWASGGAPPPPVNFARGEGVVPVVRTTGLWLDPVEDQEIDETDPRDNAPPDTESVQETTNAPVKTEVTQVDPGIVEVSTDPVAAFSRSAEDRSMDRPVVEERGAEPNKEIDSLSEPVWVEADRTPAEDLPPHELNDHGFIDDIIQSVFIESLISLAKSAEREPPKSASPPESDDDDVVQAPPAPPPKKKASTTSPIRQPSVPHQASPSGARTQAKILYLPRPNYPLMSKRLGEEGLVLLQVEVLADGSVGRINVLRDPGFPRLIDAAIAAARKTRFAPGSRAGRTVRTVARIPFRFVLQ